MVIAQRTAGSTASPRRFSTAASAPRQPVCVWHEPHAQATRGTGTAPPTLMHFSTDVFAAHERVSAWREAYGQGIAQLDLEPSSDEPFEARATLCSLPDLNIVETQTGKMTWRCCIHSDDVVLVISEAGLWTCTERGQDVRLTAGQATICMNGETTTGTTIGRRSMIRVPIKRIAPMVGNVAAKLERKVPPDATLLRLLSPYINLMRSGGASPELQRTAVAHVHDIFAMMVGPTRDGAELAQARGMRAARLRAIKDDIVQNLEHGDVSLAAVVARHRMSPRYLQKLFDSDGTTFSEYVLGQRLAYAHRALTDPRRAAEKIASIALAAGFGDVSYFYRAFRRRYDVLPSDLRATARRPS